MAAAWSCKGRGEILLLCGKPCQLLRSCVLERRSSGEPNTETEGEWYGDRIKPTPFCDPAPLEGLREGHFPGLGEATAVAPEAPADGENLPAPEQFPPLSERRNRSHR